MVVDDFVSNVIAKTKEVMSGIDQSTLKRILDEAVSSYVIQAKEGCESASDIPDKIKQYLDCRKLDGISESTTKNYRYHLNRFSQFVSKRANAISTQDLRDYLSRIVEAKHIKNSTLEEEKSILKAFFSWLESEEYITKSPANKLRPTKCPKKVRSSLSVEEIELMRNACTTPRQRCMLELFFSTGVRLAELCRIDIQDIDWHNRSIKVLGKGNKERVVYFSDKAKLYIKNYIATRGTFASPALFITSKSPHERMGRRSVEQEIKTIAEKAHICKSVYPHAFRHSFATFGVRSGMSLTTLQNLLGHETIATSQIYIDADQEAAAYEHHRCCNQ